MSKEINWQEVASSNGLTSDELERELILSAMDCMRVMLERSGNTGLSVKHAQGDETFILTFRKN